MYKHDWEYDFINPLSTTTFTEKIVYHTTGHKRNIKYDWLLLPIFAVLILGIALAIPFNDDCILYLIKIPAYIIGALMLIASAFCAYSESSTKADRPQEIERMKRIAEAEAQNERMKKMIYGDRR